MREKRRTGSAGSEREDGNRLTLPNGETGGGNVGGVKKTSPPPMKEEEETRVKGTK